MDIAICDDDNQALLQISRLVEEYSNLEFTDGQIKIHRFRSSLDLLTQIDNNKHFDVFFLDIIMPNINGMELATEIRNKDNVAKIVFLTSSLEFAVEAYSVDAFHYLLKPIQKDKLFGVLEKAYNDSFHQPDQYIIVKTKTNLTKVFFRELIYVEVIGRSLFFHDKNGLTIESVHTLSQVEAILLKDNRFFKSHRSYIVNLDHIKSLSQHGFITTSGLTIPISRKVFKEVRQTYINHCFDVRDY